MSSPHFTIYLLLLGFLSYAYAVSDENVCDTDCQFCCREKTCRSEDECKGNFQPFVILGIVAGCLVGLVVLFKVYQYVKRKNMAKEKENGGKKQRSRSRPRPKREAKPLKSKKEEKSAKKEEVYLAMENDSVIAIDVGPKPDQEQPTALEETKKNSKTDLNSKSKTDLAASNSKMNDEKKKNKTEKKENIPASRSKTPQKDKKDDGKSSKKPQPMASRGNNMKSSGNASKERGRSAGKDGKDGKDRSNSQKKTDPNGKMTKKDSN